MSRSLQLLCRSCRLDQSLSGRLIGRARYNSSSAAALNSQSPSPSDSAPAPTPSQHLYTLREIDRLVTSIAKSSKSTAHPSPLAMRTHFVPWLTSSSPDLASQADSPYPPPTDSQIQEMLTPKHMSESYTSFDLPLGSDDELRERYVNTTGGFRMGKIFEHLDSLAGAVAYRHCLPPPPKLLISTPSTQTQAFHESSSKAGLYLATASADRLDMFGRLNRDNVRDLRFSGFVTWTGRSSMEVVVKMEGSPLASSSNSFGAGKGESRTREREGERGGEWQTLMLGRFVMVCRDSRTGGARQVPPLKVVDEEEKLLWDIGEDHQKRRKESSKLALDKVPPTSEEVKELHDLMLQVVDKKIKQINGEKVVRMEDTEMETVQLMFPQDRNLHGKVFGGILMRLAFELCFTNAAIFAGGPMRFISLDQITFRLPVPIGAVLRLSSKVVKTTLSVEGSGGEAKAHIVVRAEVEEVETGLRRETNTFFFTMAKEDHTPLGKTVVPETYSEAMSYLEGQRRLELGDEMRRLYQGGMR